MAAPDGVAALAGSVRARVELPAGPLLVALSGGADSAVLAWAAAESSAAVRGVFVDHGLAASGQLREAAVAVAGVLGMDLQVVEAPVARDTPSFEATARDARYAALQAAARPDEFILTGHTADDQAETVLGNFLRGAGAGGLAGIPARRGRIARPLLTISRRQTRRLAGLLELPYFDDPDNVAGDVRRNRLRSELIPLLEETYNPQFRTALLRSSAVVAADDAVLEAAAAQVPIRADGEVVAMPAAALAVVPAAVAARVVRRALRYMRGPHGGTHDEVAAVLEVAAGVRAGAELMGAVRVEREGPMVVLSAADLAAGTPQQVEVPSVVAFDRWRVHLTEQSQAPIPRPLGAATLTLDADQAGDALVLRPLRPDDRIDIGTGSKLVTEALAERGVPRRLRARWPLVSVGERVLVIPGVRAAAWAWPSSGTMRYLVARIGISGSDSTAEGI
ncbi:MAG: tRNA lysidine(34) synthetase TilS [Acidimicrobiia bacterium]|nr:tRNA lysidine(34) synthetase TilS [Acidimicrobiia bacterium]